MAENTILSGIIREIENKIDDVNISPEKVNTGEVISLADWVARVSWLKEAAFNEMISFEEGAVWVVMNLEENFVWVVILNWFNTIAEWSTAKLTWKLLEVPVWEWLLWRVLNSLGEPIDGLWEIKFTEKYPTEKTANWVMDRKSVHQPLHTWIKAIDSLVPIWKWQRELIIWDRQTGKTQIAIDAILNQKWNNVKCIYVAIWQKESKVVALTEELKKAWAMEYTTIITANASSPAAMQWLAPYSWCAMAEYFMNNWQDSLIIYDDLTKHANAYREMSLLLRRSPGREAYPWDVFYLHSKLLERTAKLNDELWAGSMTALPIIETQWWDVSWYIPTNVISITDGQIFLDSTLFNSGLRPAIDVWLSVSRVWGAAQTKAVKKVAWTLKLDLAQFRELEAFAQFASDLDADTKSQIERGKRMVEVLKQNIYSPVPFEKIAIILMVAWDWFLDKLPVEKVLDFEKALYAKLDSEKEILESIRTNKAINDDIKPLIKELANSVLETF